MNRMYAKLATVGTRSKAGIYALPDWDEEETEPMLTEDGCSLILIAGDAFDAAGR